MTQHIESQQKKRLYSGIVQVGPLMGIPVILHDLGYDPSLSSTAWASSWNNSRIPTPRFPFLMQAGYWLSALQQRDASISDCCWESQYALPHLESQAYCSRLPPMSARHLAI